MSVEFDTPCNSVEVVEVEDTGEWMVEIRDADENPFILAETYATEDEAQEFAAEVRRMLYELILDTVGEVLDEIIETSEQCGVTTDIPSEVRTLASGLLLSLKSRARRKQRGNET